METSAISKSSLSAANDLRLDPEKLLSAFGKYGKYQVRSYLLLMTTAFFFSSQMLIMGFITRPPPFQCSITSMSDQTDYQVLDSCNVLNLKTNEIVQCSDLTNSKYLYNEMESYSTLNSEFDLVCSYQHWAEHGSSLFMLGGLLTPVITQLSDLYGRRIIFLVTLWIAGLASLACPTAPTILTFLIYRFILGAATTGYFSVMWIMCCESVALEFRSLIPVAYTVNWVLGILVVGICRIWIANWRWLYFTISVPSLFTISYYWLLPESPHWLINHGKQHAIEQYIKDASKYNNVEINLYKCESDIPNDEHSKQRTFMDIIRCKVALFHLIVQCLIMIAMNVTYWGMALLSTSLSEDGFTGYFLSGFIELPGGLLAVLLLFKFGRRSISLCSFFMQSLFQTIAALFPDRDLIHTVCAVVAKLFNTFIWTAQPLLLAEMTPTTVRNTFYGTVQFFAEIGSISAPYLYLLKNISPRAPQAAVAVISIMATLLLLTAPETKDRAMPEDLHHFQPGCFLRLFGYGKARRRTSLMKRSKNEDIKECKQSWKGETKMMIKTKN